MSLIPGLADPDEPPPRRPRGRPRHSEIPEKAQERFAFASLVLSRTLQVQEAAAAAKVTRYTITSWINEALSAPGTNADELRALARRHPRRRHWVRPRGVDSVAPPIPDDE